MKTLTALVIRLGWSRDDLKWHFTQLLTVAGLIVSGVIDLPYWATYLGLPLSTRGEHWIQVVAVVLLYLSGRYNASLLPSARTMAAGLVPGSPTGPPATLAETASAAAEAAKPLPVLVQVKP